MKRALALLILLLVIQCGILAAVYRERPVAAAGSAGQALLPVAYKQVDELRIADKSGNEAVLRKSAVGWVLPELDNLPADPEKVSALFASLDAATNNWPVASTTAARQRFQVADYYHQRRVGLLGQGRELAVIFLGTSPGFRRVHARNDQHDAIYSISFNTFDAPAEGGDWLDSRLLQVRSPLRIDADSYSLSRQDGSWRSGAGNTPDERELDALLNTLRTLHVHGTAPGDVQERLSQQEAELVLQVQGLAGHRTLELFALDGKHFIRSSEFSLFFKLSGYDFDRLAGIDFARISGVSPR